MDFLTSVDHHANEGKLPATYAQILKRFYISYSEAVTQNGYAIGHFNSMFSRFLTLVLAQLENPFKFEPYHERITAPFDYYHFGLDLIRPLIKLESSKVLGLENVDQISQQLAQKDNVILFANHQTEPDPQAISILLEKSHPNIAEEMIFVAGHRVVTDPLAVPFSMGRNLLCIYSKNYIEHPPEQKQDKLIHNQKTIKRMSQILQEGGRCIYVAPSGGRDRAGEVGQIEVAKFDPQSIELFWLIARQSGRPVHFYPLALATYHLLPPPNSIEKELGEKRHTQCTPIHMAFDKEIDMEQYPGCKLQDKQQKRIKRAEYIWELVNKDYQRLGAIG